MLLRLKMMIKMSSEDFQLDALTFILTLPLNILLIPLHLLLGGLNLILASQSLIQPIQPIAPIAQFPSASRFQESLRNIEEWTIWEDRAGKVHVTVHRKVEKT